MPRVDDYVKWNHNGHCDEGWVYFVGEEYLTIEVSVKDKPDELVNMHKKIHCLVVCYQWYWNELEYICLLYTSPSTRDATLSRMPSSA